MNIPDKVKIGGQTYRVRYDAKMPTKRGHKGECDPMDNEITLDPLMIKSQQEQTFIHEILEAINFEYPVNLEHTQIELLDAVLYQVIKDNPEIFKTQE